MSESSHDITDCHGQGSRKARENVREVTRTIRFNSWSGCFWCGLPQSICNRWEDNGRGGYQRAEAGDCQYKGVLISGIAGILFGYGGQVWRLWQLRLQERGVIHSMEGGFSKEVIEYLGKKRRLSVVESNNLVGEFCWLTSLLVE